MKITRRQLRQIIKEELSYVRHNISEAIVPGETVVKGRLNLKSEYIILNVDADISKIEVRVKTYPREKSAVGKTFFLDKLSSEEPNHPLIKNVKALMSTQSKPAQDSQEEPEEKAPPLTQTQTAPEEMHNHDLDHDHNQNGRTITVNPNSKLGRAKFKDPLARAWAQDVRKLGRLTNRLVRKLKRKGIDMTNIKGSLKANGGKYDSIDHVYDVAESFGISRKIIDFFERTLGPEGVRMLDAIEVMTHDEIEIFVSEIAKKYPEFELKIGKNGIAYNTPSHERA